MLEHAWPEAKKWTTTHETGRLAFGCSKGPGEVFQSSKSRRRSRTGSFRGFAVPCTRFDFEDALFKANALEIRSCSGSSFRPGPAHRFQKRVVQSWSTRSAPCCTRRGCRKCPRNGRVPGSIRSPWRVDTRQLLERFQTQRLEERLVHGALRVPEDPSFEELARPSAVQTSGQCLRLLSAVAG